MAASPFLLLDVGNSAIKWRLGDAHGLRQDGGESDTIAALCTALADYRWCHVALASVASDEADSELIDALQSLRETPVWRAVPQSACLGVTNSYADPRTMGVDRWVAMIGAWCEFGGPLCVVDAGTAITVDVLDGDGQNIPSDLPALEAALLDMRPAQGMAGGVRVSRKDTGIRRQASAFARGARRSLLRDDHPDSGCGIKIVDRDLFVKLPFFNHMHRFMPTLVRGEGGTVLAVPVGHRARTVGQSKYGILDRLIVGIADLAGVIWLMRRRAHPGAITELPKPASVAKAAKPKSAGRAKPKSGTKAKSAAKKPSQKRG